MIPAVNPTDISFEKGAIISVVSKDGQGTWTGTIDGGKEGTFPKGLVEPYENTEETAGGLDVKLQDMAEAIFKLGLAAALLTAFILWGRYSYQFIDGLPWKDEFWKSKILDPVIIAVTVLVVAVPEGLPLAVSTTQSSAQLDVHGFSRESRLRREPRRTQRTS